MARHNDHSRGGWVKHALLVVLVATGGAVGAYLSGGWPGGKPLDASGGDSRPADRAETALHRFPLVAADIRDTVEAASMTADGGGRVYLVWTSQTGPEERTLWLARTEDSGEAFGPPRAVTKSSIFRAVSKRKDKAVTREVRMMPHIAAGGGKIHLLWTETLPDSSGVRLVTAASADAGTTFPPGHRVHHAERSRVGFTALAVGPARSLAASWLDNRRGGQLPFGAVRRSGQDEFDEERMVYGGQDGKGVCPCCPTAASFAPDGTLYVAFRNIHDGYRDISVCRLRPGESAFEGPFPVTGNTWKFDGCPHDGPSLAVRGDTLHVAWMDARNGRQRCYHARAKLAGDLKFAGHAELHAGGAGSQGNAKLFADAAGVLHAVWEESLGAEPASAHEGHRHGPPQVGQGGGRAVLHARLRGAGFEDVRPVAPKPGAFQTRPVIVGTTGSRLFIAWSELDESGKAVVVARLPARGQESQP